MQDVALWTVCEQSLTAARTCTHSSAEVEVRVELTSPSGRVRRIDAFWDGGATWRFRFAPGEPGRWRWRSMCRPVADPGLEAEGEFRCVPYTGDNPLRRRGPLRLSQNRRHLEHADGTPFLWLADTAWNGALKARPDDWQRYLRTRCEQGFTAIQFVSTHWRAYGRDIDLLAFDNPQDANIRPEFFQRLDPMVAAINEAGLVAAPVMLWAFSPGDPGVDLAEEAAIRLARHLQARWGAYNVVWLLAGDGDYRQEKSRRWQTIGRAVFADGRDRLVTMHPGGGQWVGDEFRQEPWFDFIGYQSGHGNSPDALRWLVWGPPATQWDGQPACPVINLEPNYEAHPAYGTSVPFTDRQVRRAAWWSLLVSRTAGVTYGHNGVWPWNQEHDLAEGHEKMGPVPSWQDGLHPPGTRSMTVLRRFFDSLDWCRLKPAPQRVLNQAANETPERFIAAADDGQGRLLIAYLPVGGCVRLDLRGMAAPAKARWFDPRGGQWTPALTPSGDTVEWTAPDDRDWVLVING